MILISSLLDRLLDLHAVQRFLDLWREAFRAPGFVLFLFIATYLIGILVGFSLGWRLLTWLITGHL